MDDLKTQIEESAKALKNAWTMVQATSGRALPPKCYERWSTKASLHRILASTASIMPAREMAWETVLAITSPADPTDNLVRYGTLLMDFAIARHLALASYVTVTWSIYDRLTNVCGRLVSVSELSDDPKQNPKLCEDLLGKKDILGFNAHLHIRHAYTWPVKLSYKVRNWLVHEGYEEGNIPMFKGNLIADGLQLHDDAVVHLQNCCSYVEENGKIVACCLNATEECWPTQNLLIILEKYHAEIDMMFSGLIKWSVNSFVGQIAAFAERDKTGLTTAAATRFSYSQATQKPCI